MDAVPNSYNGVALCTGSLSSNSAIGVPGIIRSLKGRINFAHIRNTKHRAPVIFEEAAHCAADGSLDMSAIVKVLVDIGYDGSIRPSHGRGIWGEKSMPGYGLSDGALGSQFILGLYDAIPREDCRN